MSEHAFPALGFDPAPGSPDALARLGHDCGALSVALLEDSSRVRALADTGVWRGEAAAAFRHRLSDLPRDLDRAADAYGRACTAIARFSGDLLEAQVRARALERQAEGADDTQRGEVCREAHRLRQQVQEAAGTCGRALQEATRHAPHPPSWFSRMVDAGVHLVQAVNDTVGDFVREHAEVIAGLAAALSKASSALATVAMLAGPIPIIGQAVGSLAAGTALVAAGTAVALHTALAVYADGSWGDVLLDATAVALGAAPHGVEAAAEAVVAGRIARGASTEALGKVSMSMGEAVQVLGAPRAAASQMARSTLSFPGLVTRTVSYQFDLAGGAVGIVDLARIGSRPAEVEEAGRRGREAQDRRDAAAGDPRLVEVVACRS